MRSFAELWRFVSAVASPLLLRSIGAYLNGIVVPSQVELSVVVIVIISTHLQLPETDADDPVQMA